jgi:iron complex outermembrane receptor protein
MERSPPGGLVNLVSKRPPLEPIHELLFQIGNYDRFQGGVDFGGPIDTDRHFLYRLTGFGRDADTQVDFTKDQRLLIAPALTWRPSNDTMLTLLTSFQYDPAAGFFNSLPGQGTVFSNPNGKIPTSRFTGDPNFDTFERTQYAIGYLFEHRFNDVWTVRQNFRYLYVGEEMDLVFPLDGFQPDLRTVDCGAFLDREHLDAITLDNQSQAKFDTGPLQHALLFGLDYQRAIRDRRFGFGTAPSLELFSPIYHQAITRPDTTGDTHQTQNQIGLYLQDQSKLGPWVLLLGGRHDWADSDTRNRLNDTTTTQSDSALTWRAGLVYLFDIGLAPYFSYAESFQPTSGTDFDGMPFKPTRGRQYEVGVKYQPKGFNSFITLSAFHLTQQNVLTADPEHDFFSVQRGEIRSRGIEVEGKANLGEGLGLTAAYTYLDSVVTRANEDTQEKHPVGIPKHQASL